MFGVTGSGKTKVYMKLIDDCLDKGQSCILMVPEISLTPGALPIFYSRYGDTVAVVHSALSMGERLDEFKRIQSGEARLVIGTRSAVFSPVQNLKLIIIDEEQEHTYKSSVLRDMMRDRLQIFVQHIIKVILFWFLQLLRLRRILLQKREIYISKA